MVTFIPDRARRRFRHQTALVLGAGGVLGAAWMTGALECLQDRLPHPVADVDLIVGTSAGSVMAAALRCGATLEEMASWQRGEAAGLLGESAVLAAQDGPLPPLPRLRLGSRGPAQAVPDSPVGGRERLAPVRPGPAHRAAITDHRAAPASSPASQPGRGAAAALDGRPHVDHRHGLRHRTAGRVRPG